MRVAALWICWMVLTAPLCFAGEGGVEVTDVSIKPRAAQEKPDENGNMYLYIRLRNKGLRKAENLNLEISYYAKDGLLIQKSVLRKPLQEGMFPNEEKDYVLHLDRYNKTLFGSLDMKSEGQYPYDRDKDLDGVRIIAKDIKYVWS